MQVNLGQQGERAKWWHQLDRVTSVEDGQRENDAGRLNNAADPDSDLLVYLSSLFLRGIGPSLTL